MPHAPASRAFDDSHSHLMTQPRVCTADEENVPHIHARAPALAPDMA